MLYYDGYTRVLDATHRQLHARVDLVYIVQEAMLFIQVGSIDRRCLESNSTAKIGLEGSAMITPPAMKRTRELHLAAVICSRFSSARSRPSSLALDSACPIVSDSCAVSSDNCQ